MQSKSFLIAIAAFALTATGVQAYGGAKILGRAGLTEEQVEAIEEARELRALGDHTGARNKLLEAGIDEETLRSMRDAAREVKDAIREAIEADDYEAFKVAVADAPLADIITSKADFEQLVEAHEMRMAGEVQVASEILDELGLEPHFGGHPHRGDMPQLQELTDEQRETLQVAHQANDRATIQAILEEAGIDLGPRHMH
ncbi:MAG: hypothetical protein KC877_01905 [Candidatus Kaiserbacteria bacterium]|nr:hypothetical protein [Candidatus Kaiserbacteria bacterium]MCB9815895.1 hypothetical protein [Candidatus Nomurabacteria bacterium]